MTNRVLTEEEAVEILKGQRRKFYNRKLRLAGIEFNFGVYFDEDQKVLKLELPGKWRIDSVFAGKTDDTDTVILIDKAQ